MWCWKRKLDISWTERGINECILIDIKPPQHFNGTVYSRIVTLFCQINTANNMEKYAFKGKCHFLFSCCMVRMNQEVYNVFRDSRPSTLSRNFWDAIPLNSEKEQIIVKDGFLQYYYVICLNNICSNHCNRGIRNILSC